MGAGWRRGRADYRIGLGRGRRLAQRRLPRLVLGAHDAQAPGQRAPLQDEELPVAAQQPAHAPVQRQVEEDLVVRIAAGEGRGGSRPGHSAVAVESAQRARPSRLLEPQSGIGEHALELVPNARDHRQDEAPGLDGFAEGASRRVVVDEPGEPDIGVEDRFHAIIAALPDALPFEMLIVLSPAKRLDFERPVEYHTHTRPSMLAESRRLVARLRACSPPELAALMGISDSLASLNAARYEQWRTPFTTANARPAIFAFAGDVYDGLRADTLDGDGLEWAQGHLRILSGLYGVLRPLDLMQPYRLEMGTRLPTERGPDLYSFWGTRIAHALRRAMKDAGAGVLVNLASQEYFRSVDRSTWRAPIVQPVFEQWHGGRWKVISFDAKRARGAMARFAIDHRLGDAEGLKAFDRDGYAFDPAASDETRWVFRRR